MADGQEITPSTNFLEPDLVISYKCPLCLSIFGNLATFHSHAKINHAEKYNRNAHTDQTTPCSITDSSMDVAFCKKSDEDIDRRQKKTLMDINIALQNKKGCIEKKINSAGEFRKRPKHIKIKGMSGQSDIKLVMTEAKEKSTNTQHTMPMDINIWEHDINHDQTNIQGNILIKTDFVDDLCDSGVISSEEWGNVTKASKSSDNVKALTCCWCQEVLPNAQICLQHYAQSHAHNMSLSIERKKLTDTLLLKQNEKIKSERLEEIEGESANCHYCKQKFLLTKLFEHVNLIHFWGKCGQNADKKVVCSLCGKTLQYARNLKQHMRSVHEGVKRTGIVVGCGRNMLICEMCGFTTAEKRRLIAHQLKHDGKMMYSCPHCDYKTWERTSLKDHSYRHKTDKKYQCAHCSYTCIQRNSLRGHLKSKHGLNLPPKGTNWRQFQLKKKGTGDESSQSEICNSKFVVCRPIVSDVTSISVYDHADTESTDHLTADYVLVSNLLDRNILDRNSTPSSVSESRVVVENPHNVEFIEVITDDSSKSFDPIDMDTILNDDRLVNNAIVESEIGN